MKKAALQTPSIQSLDRGLFILEAVAKSNDPVPLGQLTDLLGIDRSSVFRLANTLRRRGFLANPSGRKDYILGPSIWRLSRSHDWSDMLITFSHEHLKKLAVTDGRDHAPGGQGGAAGVLCRPLLGDPPVSWSPDRSASLCPCTARRTARRCWRTTGLTRLKATFGAGRLQGYTPTTITTLKQLAKECARIRAAGFAVDEEEYVEGVRCLAAPVRDRDGAVIASIGISAPIARFPLERDAAAGREVCETAAEISAILSAEVEE